MVVSAMQKGWPRLLGQCCCVERHRRLTSISLAFSRQSVMPWITCIAVQWMVPRSELALAAETDRSDPAGIAARACPLPNLTCSMCSWKP